MKKIIAIVGNNAQKSTNRQLIEYIQKRYNDLAEIEKMEVKDFPLYRKSLDAEIPAIARDYSKKIEQADGVIISTPEYDHAPPAALINALAWLTKEQFPFVFKPVMLVGASYGILGSSRAQAQLRQILSAPVVRANLMPGQEFYLNHSLQAFDEVGNLVDEEKVELLDALIKDFLVFIDVNCLLVDSRQTNLQAAQDFSWQMDQEHRGGRM